MVKVDRGILGWPKGWGIVYGVNVGLITVRSGGCGLKVVILGEGEMGNLWAGGRPNVDGVGYGKGDGGLGNVGSLCRSAGREVRLRVNLGGCGICLVVPGLDKFGYRLVIWVGLVGVDSK